MAKIIKTIAGRGMPFEEDDVDTDTIAPSGSMLTVDWNGTAAWLFAARRKDPNHALNNPSYQGANVLFTGSNFGCGSSREHAPQAILRGGYEIVVAVSYAGIFSDNCRAIGLPAVAVTQDDLKKLISTVKDKPQTQFAFDLERRTASFDGQTVPFNISDVTREQFLKGTWDEKDALLARMPKIKELASRNPYVCGYQ